VTRYVSGRLGEAALVAALALAAGTAAQGAPPPAPPTTLGEAFAAGQLDHFAPAPLRGCKLRLLGTWVESSLSSGSIDGQDSSDDRVVLYHNVGTTPRALLGRDPPGRQVRRGDP
jgi:hypothetical protein